MFTYIMASSTRIRKFVKTQIFFLRIRLASTRIQRIFRPYLVKCVPMKAWGSINVIFFFHFCGLLFHCMCFFQPILCSVTKQHLQFATIATVMNIDILSFVVRHLGNFRASLLFVIAAGEFFYEETRSRLSYLSRKSFSVRRWVCLRGTQHFVCF